MGVQECKLLKEKEKYKRREGRKLASFIKTLKN